MSTQDRVAAAVRFFFDRALPAATGKHWSDLHDPKCHLGAYATYSGQPVATPIGQSITPKYVLNVGKRPLPVAQNLPNAQGATVGSDPVPRHLLWVRQVADAKVDTADEIRRVMADLDSFAHLFDNPQGATAAPAPSGPPPSAAWATAIASAGVRAALPDDLAQLTTVPAGLADLASDVNQLKDVLHHFFTWDEGGRYYPRWAGAGRDANDPSHLHATYKQKNLVEVKLERGQIYLYAVVPQALLAGAGDGDQSVFREIVVRFDEAADADVPFTLATVHTAAWHRDVAPHEDFVFFAADVGEGLPTAPEIRRKLNPLLGHFLGKYLRAGADHQDAVLAAERNVTRAGGAALVHVIAAVDGAPTYPAGTTELSGGAVRSLSVPVDKLLDLAALPAVKRLSIVHRPKRLCDVARNAVHFNDLLGKMAAGTQGGKNVLVGVIDTGIDGSHKDFGNRVIAFWDQGSTPTVAGNTPAQNHNANLAYSKMTYGVELLAAPLAPVTATPPKSAGDPGGHGTHVSGIAAGNGVPDPANPGSVLVPAGFASEAWIAVVRTIEVGAPDAGFLDGIRWLFLKADELGIPCVINMSFGHHGHPHDGTDDESQAVHALATDAHGAYLPGKILVASAGNERKDHIHMRRPVPAHGSAEFQVQIPAGSFTQAVILWIKNPNPAADPNAGFPLDVVVTGRSLRRHTAISTTPAVRLGNDVNHPGFPNHRTQIDVFTRRAFDQANHDFLVEVIFNTTDPPPAPGAAVAQLAMLEEVWTIQLLNRSGAALDAHAWALDGCTLPQSTQPDDEAFLVGVPACGPAAISVAASVTRNQWIDGNTHQPSTAAVDEPNPPDLASFSSPGPLRFASVPPERVYPTVHHEINGIDVTAPGAYLWSALSHSIAANELALFTNVGLVVNAEGVMLAGTSMASPVITGIVANLLADNPHLTLPDVLQRLHTGSHIPASSNFQPPGPGGEPSGTPPGHPGYSRDWGYGLVNAAELK